MVKMKKKPNYGYPLSHILFRIFIFILLVLLLVALIPSKNSIYLILILSIFIISAYVFFGIIQFKKHFLKNRMELLKKCIQIANLKGDETVLDLGTGSGFLAIGFAKHLQKGKSFGLDRYSLKYNDLKSTIINKIKINFIVTSLKNAENNSKIEDVEKKCKFIQIDITKPLDFPDNYFDIIVSSQFIYCISHQKRPAVFKEINRILKKGGKIIFFEYGSFLGWDINSVKEFFENIGYKIELIPVDEFKKCYILYGQK